MDRSQIDGWFRPNVRQMRPYVPGEQPQGGKFIKLNTNENPYPPSPAAVRAIQQAADGALVRYPDPLATAFRIQAAEVLGVDPEWILCGNGSDDILTIVTRALVGEGDRLRMPTPSYILYRTLAEIQAAQVDEVPFAEGFQLSPEFGRPHPRLRLAFLPNPNSPTGTVVPPEVIQEVAQRLPCPLLVDEAYADFADVHCIDLVRKDPRIMVSRTLSKSYGLAGLRFGFLIAQPPIIEMLRKVKDSYNCDVLAIAGATAAIADQAWFAENRAKVIATRSRLHDGLRGLGFEVITSYANFVWCTHPQHASRSLYERLKADGVLVRYMDYPGWGDGLRISVGTDDQIDACLSLLAGYVAGGSGIQDL
ncbi:MAG: histidinol-phosphate transaminase [Planctomycetota bacterium]|nr:MAG: histidinol-phosphate transaminase [Planctomycetota bacterium]